jgi:hypothetical protein
MVKMAERYTVHKEMGYTRAEFLRLLPKALGDDGARIDGSLVELKDGSRRMSIEIGDEGQRQLGNFRLPVLPVRLEFYGYSATDVEAVLEHFWRTYQKGGG